MTKRAAPVQIRAAKLKAERDQVQIGNWEKKESIEKLFLVENLKLRKKMERFYLPEMSSSDVRSQKEDPGPAKQPQPQHQQQQQQ